MIIPDINAIHEIAPPAMFGGISNRSLPENEMLYFRTRGVSMADKQEFDRDSSMLGTTLDPKERMKERSQLEYARARKKLVSIHNYYVPVEGGAPRQVTDFDDFIRVAPPELVEWYLEIIQVGERLSAADRRLFLSPPDSLSGSQSGEDRESGTVKTAIQSGASAAIAET